MSEVISVLAVSCICVLAHLVYFCFKIKPKGFRSGFRKLMYQAKIIILIWLLGVPFCLVLNAVFKNMGLESAAGSWFYLGYSIFLFLCLFFLYLTIYYIIDRSVSSRIMIEIEESRGKKLNFDSLVKAYDVDSKYKDVLDGMLQGGFAYKDGDFYRCTKKGLIVGCIADFFKSALKLGKGG